MTVLLKKPVASATPIRVVDRASLVRQLEAEPPATRRWLAAAGFEGAPDSHLLLPDAEGALQAVWAGVRDITDPWALSALPRRLPAGRYRLDDAGLALDPESAAMSWALGGYAFERYKKAKRQPAELMLAGHETLIELFDEIVHT